MSVEQCPRDPRCLKPKGHTGWCKKNAGSSRTRSANSRSNARSAAMAELGAKRGMPRSRRTVIEEDEDEDYDDEEDGEEEGGEDQDEEQSYRFREGADEDDETGTSAYAGLSGEGGPRAELAVRTVHADSSASSTLIHY